MPVVDGHSITITHPDKVLFPDDGITKADLADYYLRIADRMLPHVRHRPLHMNRFPDGIGGIAIQQKRVPDSFPRWIDRATVEKQGGTVTHAVINNAATLVYLANYNMITAHVWASRIEAIWNPDVLIFDLDPADEDFTLVRTTALKVRAILEERGLVCFVKTTGSRGLHVIAPITPGPTFDLVHMFADFVAQQLAASDPEHLTTEFLKDSRQGRLFIDVNRNAYAQTIVAPYSVRARRGAPIALPVAWSDVERKDLRADGVTMRTVWKWLANREDPWQSMDQARRPLPSLKDSERPDRSGRRRGTTKEQRARRATAAVSTKH